MTAPRIPVLLDLHRPISHGPPLIQQGTAGKLWPFVGLILVLTSWTLRFLREGGELEVAVGELLFSQNNIKKTFTDGRSLQKPLMRSAK